ncbi:MAG TPA: SGNH/GDSL hydrolase family protein [Streptosporangiaceae bacterium]|nr:SGNH/GDSL hydrolase family protein [Streptosporangiaceae bacterium]
MHFRISRRSRLSRLSVLAATVGMAGFAALAVSGAASAASSVHYVALGDSYSSGLGAGSTTDGSCLQSAGAYGVLWANAHAPASFANETCSGATTSSVISTQLGPLNSTTTLVSITIGGNDVGFSSVLETCVLDSTTTCVNAVNSAEAEANSTLPGALDNVLSAIRSRAPNAQIVVLDYPQFYDLSKSSTCIGLSTTDRQAINGGAALLDSLIQQAAQRNGDSFADVNPFFSGHRICDSSSYLHSVNFLDLDESYHPNASGQADAYLPAMETVAP